MENGAASTREECGESVEKSIGGRRISLFREFANEYEDPVEDLDRAVVAFTRAIRCRGCSVHAAGPFSARDRRNGYAWQLGSGF